MSFYLLLWYPCEMSIEYNCEDITSYIFVTNHSRFEAKRMKDDDVRYVQPIIMQHWITFTHESSIHPNLILPCQIQVWGMNFSEKSYAILLILLSLPLSLAQFAKQQACSFISIWINLYNTFMLLLFTIVCVGFEVHLLN